MCGILGVVAENAEVNQEIYTGLWSEQHRGQESAGIVTYDGVGYHEKRAMGTVDIALRNDLGPLLGRVGIGHVRYSNTGGSTIENAQPIEGVFRSVPFWIAHNGNLTNFEELRQECLDRGYFFRTTTDTEVIAALTYFNEDHNFEDALRQTLLRLKGTYSLVLLYKDTVYGIRDKSGNRPLVYGEGRGIRVLASESVSCDVLGIKYITDVYPGEMFTLKGSEPYSCFDPATNRVNDFLKNQKFCIFEYVYFKRPDSIFDGRRIKAPQIQMGRNLWRESPVEADCVIPVLDSGKFAAVGLSLESGLPIEEALFRSHYVGRTFIEPIQERREKGLRIKHNPITEDIEGKRIVVVDDSIIRSTTMKRVVVMLREASAKEVHVRISSPPYRHPCYYGIDTYRVKDELIAKRLNGDVEAIRQEIGADSLYYISLEGLKRSVVEASGPTSHIGMTNFCDACFSGDYYIPISINKN